ncbi:protein OSB2, chloroplastic-like [Neltuma alba]|uniref:protein OSB2, chloroplastic-like n=1 Tax=Neltuma alba TaxID=207710 RepID=UPI0010A4DAE1|nr:protein OSB2, chloroplastic-like [Prosopis alba]XP_028778148.1 protein OSB2, chloroplastic-like [Prosopis alba]
MYALRRAVRVFASSAIATGHLVSHPSTFIRQSYATAATTRRRSKRVDEPSPPSKDDAVSDRQRPPVIPYQPKAANFVNIIGQVHMPVQFQTSPDGKTWATTVLIRELTPDSSHLWIPVKFEGDLAHVAACHLKENDYIHVAGELGANSSYSNESKGQSNIQVLARSLNFVQGYPLVEEISAASKQQGISDSSDRTKKNFGSTKNSDSDPLLSSWRDLLKDPKQWWDCRDSKHNGLVNFNYPDFKRKDGSHALWLDRAPNWVLSDLEGLEFDALILKSKQAKEQKDDANWRDVVENPDKWWDNRSTKKTERSPDFKHKETGEALWLNSSPSWVLPKLPPLKEKEVEPNAKQELIS